MLYKESDANERPGKASGGAGRDAAGDGEGGSQRPTTTSESQHVQSHAGPGADTLRAQALARMQVIGAQKAQRRRAGEMIDRQADLGRALRRGGERGDVVGPGKRKNEFAGGPFAPRQRIEREQYSIAT